MDYGIKVAKEGKSSSSSDPRDYSFHSYFNQLKIFDEVHGVISLSTTVVGTVNNTHNLGYKPLIFSYFEHPEVSKWYSAPCRTYNALSTPPTWDLISVMKHVSANEIQVRFYDDGFMTSSPTNVQYKYYILVDPREGAWYDPASTDTDSETLTNSYGIRIARPNIDVKTAEPQNLVYSSKFNTFKIAKIVKFTSAGSSAHGLGYPPAFFVLKEDPTYSGEWIRGDVNPFLNGSYPLVNVDGTNVNCLSSGTYYVILFTDPLNE
jgi:hypothetical protein